MVRLETLISLQTHAIRDAVTQQLRDGGVSSRRRRIEWRQVLLYHRGKHPSTVKFDLLNLLSISKGTCCGIGSKAYLESPKVILFRLNGS